MIVGDIKKISLSSSFFERTIAGGRLYIDKTRMIENFLTSESEVNLVVRQRRLGKSMNMDMLQCFLTDRTDYRHLFKGLYIESSPVWEKVNSAPVFSFDFKGLRASSYKNDIRGQTIKHVCSMISPDDLDNYYKWRYNEILTDDESVKDSLRFLTELAHGLTGKRSYLLIDEYDKLLMDNFKSDKYEEIKTFETAMLSAAVKGNPYLEKALLTGVMRISHESMFSDLNNIKTFDLFRDEVFTDDYGITEEEALELSQRAGFDINKVRTWYNGVRVNGKAIFNTYSMVSFIEHEAYDCYWGKSGTLDMIIDMLNDNRRMTIANLLNGGKAEVFIDERISLTALAQNNNDDAFYSLLVQAGYLALEERFPEKSSAIVSIPNKELNIVWKNFILKNLYPDRVQLKTLFDNVDYPKIFAKDIEYFLNDRLSYHDLSVNSGEVREVTHERAYHLYLLGLLSAYEDMRCRFPLSNRESGNGRYDILVERQDANYIFELKGCKKEEDLEAKAVEAAEQIDVKRYGADMGKRLVKLGVAFSGKRCRVYCL